MPGYYCGKRSSHLQRAAFIQPGAANTIAPSTHPEEARTMSTQPSREPIRLYGFALSGHCHRVELFLALLDLPYTVRAWLRRVEGLPRFVPIASSPVGLCA
jgi:hypothetical protein